MKAIFFILTFLSTHALAKSAYDLTTSVRAVGMGGAFVAAVDNTYSMFYNIPLIIKIESIKATTQFSSEK